MPKITKHIPVRRGFDTVWLQPGDELPEWAVGLVGDHALEYEQVEGLEPGDFGLVGTTDEAVAADDSVPVEPGIDATPEALTSDVAPDFTKPAAPKRGRARKAE